jgi:uncharacterized protein
MNTNPIRWFEIYVQDMARARRFYESVFQVKLERLDSPVVEMWMFPQIKDQTGSGGSLVKANGVASGGNSILIYFACDDCAVEGARVSESGGKVVRAKMSIGQYGFVVLAHDTEGNLIGLHSLR